MISQETFERCVLRAGLAPTVHNTQPARWMRDGNVLSLLCDTDVGLPAADPSGDAAGLSCGAVLEAMILALSAEGIRATATFTNKDTAPQQGLVAVAHLALTAGREDGLQTQLENRFTWRGGFATDRPDLYGWTRPDARLVLDEPGRTWLADRNDWASLQIMRQHSFRHELVQWMRMNDSHPRAGLDGMDRASMQMTLAQARGVSFALIRLWGVLNLLGRTKALTSERDVTLTSPVISLFHCDISENPIVSGQAYLRMCLEAASLGLAGWPMASLADHPTSCAQVCDRFGIPPGRRLVQVIRFGVPAGDAPRRARRPVAEVVR